MDKLIMAHEFAKIILDSGLRGDWDLVNLENVAADAFILADAMQAEADKRNNKETCDKNIGLDSSVLKPSNSMELEWQPDWSQAPVWVNVWAMDKNGIAHWYCGKYDLDQEFDCWMYDSCGLGDGTWGVAPSFDYKGHWQNSLRKRPQGE